MDGGAYLHLLGPFGVEADYSKHYGVSPNEFGGIGYYVPGLTQLYGPRFTLALPRIHPYVHALFGTVHGETAEPAIGAPCGPLGCPSPNLSENAFGMAFGGGLNVKAPGISGCVSSNWTTFAPNSPTTRKQMCVFQPDSFSDSASGKHRSKV